MGIGLFRSWKSSATTIPKSSETEIQYRERIEKELREELERTIKGNPDPRHFIVKNYEQFGNYLVILVHYPNCKNFEGKKILVYHNVSWIKICQTKYLDPHFTKDETGNPSPIARFIPTQEGWKMAKDFAKTLQSQSEKVDINKIVQRLKDRANLYMSDDGEPGPLSDQWGWRDIAETLRKEAKLLEEGLK